MAMALLKVKAALTVVLLLLLAASTLVVSAEEAPPPSSAVYHFNLIHSNGNLSRDEEHGSGVFGAAEEAEAAADTTTYSGGARYDDKGGEYLMVVGIGTGSTTGDTKRFTAVVDTGSDVIWTRHCPDDSSSFKRSDAEFHKWYGSIKLDVSGFMATESLVLSSGKADRDAAVSVALGCAQKCDACDKLIPAAADGVIGLNRGPKSLLKQLEGTKLSYCLGSRLDPDQRSPLWIGAAGAKLRLAGADVQSTPLVGHAGTDPGSVGANRYYVKLEGVSVTTATTTTAAAAAPPVSIPGEAFNHRSNDVEGKKGVMFVDSGCTYSHLETAAYNVVKNLLTEQLKAKPFPGSNNNKPWNCFEVHYDDSAANSIHVNLHLAKDGDGGATMSLGWSNYMKPGDETRTTSCLAIKDSGQNISVLGNFQQQNIHMLYDLDKEKLFFVPVQDCTKSKIKLID